MKRFVWLMNEWKMPSILYKHNKSNARRVCLSNPCSWHPSQPYNFDSTSMCGIMHISRELFVCSMPPSIDDFYET
ncbi:hypothetical protein BofuT4_P125450.1 [Botrytis cinerea T4]|uniref:Uncharacterized protein n=1 Tax=Botryotinia fuckeliana (strain T4) TaxID=999810 RepID=G2YS99_BOTF4|nr:hypothetical protein BofuT4_P125450.1 [Botrytis cinerea T4]